MAKKKLNKKKLSEIKNSIPNDKLAILNEYGEVLHHLIDDVDASTVNVHKVIEMRSHLEKMPEQLANMLGDAYVICEHMIELANAPASMKEIMRQNYYRIRKELQIDQTKGMLQVMLDQVATAWCRLQVVDHEYTRISSEGHTLRELRYWDQRLAASQARFDKAVATVANTIQKLGPNFSIQVNIAKEGGKQVNIGNKE